MISALQHCETSTDLFAVQENGKAVTGPDMTVKLNGLTMPNPFVIGSGENSLPHFDRAHIQFEHQWFETVH